MPGQTHLLVLLFPAVFAVLAVAGRATAADSKPAGSDPVPPAAESNSAIAGVNANIPEYPIPALEAGQGKLVRLPFTGSRRVVSPAGGSARGDESRTEKLIYSSTLGYPAQEVFVYRPGHGIRVADDLVLETVSDCTLSSLRVLVNGGVEGGGGEFGVQLNLWDGCPNAGGVEIPGSRTTILDLTNDLAVFHELVIDFADRGICTDQSECSLDQQNCGDGSTCVPDPVVIPPTVWLRVAFNTETAGIVVGTPAERGFSADKYDWPGVPCGAWFGGYPAFPHASFWTQVHSTSTDECSIAYLAYRGTGDPFVAPLVPSAGPITRVADDINLVVDTCEVAAYELGIIGYAGLYTVNIDLRWPTIDDVVDGSQGVFVGRGEGSLEVAHVNVPEGLLIAAGDQPIWITWQANRPATGVPMGIQTQIGYSGPHYAMLNVPSEPPGWQLYTRPGGLPAVAHATISCRGVPPLGSCCPGQQPDVPNAEPLCFDDVPPVGCLSGRWLEGVTCAESPFDPPCGKQACCLPSNVCADLSRDECLSNCQLDVTPIACETDDDCPGLRTCGSYQCHDGAVFTGATCNPNAGSIGCPAGQACVLFDPGVCGPKCARWSGYEFCGDQGMPCRYFACYGAVGACEHGEPSFACADDADCPNGSACNAGSNTCTARVGCDRLLCCDSVCRADPFCCAVAWDNECAVWANFLGDCTVSPPANNECYHSIVGRGAFPIVLVDDDTSGPCTSPDSVSCSRTMPADNTEATAKGSDPRFCCHKGLVNTYAKGTIWYKFTAAHNTARIHTCDTPASETATDSLLQVFKPQSTGDLIAECSTLEVIGCNDDYAYCGEGTNSSICVTGLMPGETYYVLLGSRSTAHQGPYRISVESPCPAHTVPGGNNWCESATTVGDGIFPFTLEGAIFDCPAESELPSMINDLWWRYTATCTGFLTIETCDPAGQGDNPATNLAVYEGSTCPPDSLLAVSDDAGDDCGPASSVTLLAHADDEFTIRLGGEHGGEPEGVLSIRCDPDDCNANGLFDHWELETGAALDCNQNAQPDGCDVAVADPDQNGQVSADCDANGVPDECQIHVTSQIDCTLIDPAPCHDGPFFCSSDCAADLNQNGIPDGCDDPDGDGVLYPPDNCPNQANSGQGDCNGDGQGDVCEIDPAERDDDTDGACNSVDNCPAFANPHQRDKDDDGLGDGCDPCPKIPGPCPPPLPEDPKRRPFARD